MKPYMPVVAEILNDFKPKKVLDTPSGKGWLFNLLNFETELDGIDLFEDKPTGYSNFFKADLEYGIPKELETYEAIVSCEGIEHIGNPQFFLESIRNKLKPDGLVIITTPNVWYPTAKMQFLLRGFFPSFPCLVGKIKRGSHMHITPWSFPHLYLYLKLAGFSDIKLYDLEEKKPKYVYEYLPGFIQKNYCRGKIKKTETQEERDFWNAASSDQSIYGRRLVVSAIKKDV